MSLDAHLVDLTDSDSDFTSDDEDQSERNVSAGTIEEADTCEQERNDEDEHQSLDLSTSTYRNTSTVSSTIRSKRPYKYLKRVPCPRKKTEMRKRWKQDVEGILDSLVSKGCCKKLQCFTKIDKSFLKGKMETYRAMTFEDRRLALQQMLGSSGKFHFDGHTVCNNFLKLAFRFSLDLISSVRNGVNTKPQQVKHVTDLHSQTTSNSDRGAVQRDAIITHLERLAESCGDMMPDVHEIHLPFFRKWDVYAHFKNELNILFNNNEKCPCKSFFYRTWKIHCRKIKVRKVGRFTKCTTCERLRKAIGDAVANHDLKTVTILRRAKAEQNELISKERREYNCLLYTSPSPRDA